MPFIPKLRPVGEIAAVPNAPLDRLQRPTVNLSGVRQAVGQLGAASQMPLDNNDVTQGFRALGAVGEAVMKAGSVIGAVAMKRQEATDRRLVNQAQSAMDMAAMEFKAWQAENQNSPEAWTAEAQRRSADLLKPFMEMKELSKSAKDDLALMGQSWAGRFTKSVEIDATKAVFSLAAGSYQDRANRAYDQGDAAAGDAAIDEATTLGYFHPTVAESAKANGKLKTEAKAEAQRFDDLLGFADEKPLEAPGLIEQYHKEGKITSAQKLRLDNVRESAVNRERARDNEFIKTAWMNGQIKEPADLEAFPHLTESDKAEWKQQLQKPVMNDGAEYERTLGAIARYKAADDPTGAQLAELRTVIAKRFDTGFEQTLKEKLDAKTDPAAPDMPLDVARAWLDEQVFDRDGLGKWKSQRTDDAGRPVFIKEKTQSLNAANQLEDVENVRPEMVEDKVKKAALGEKVKAIMAEVERATKAGEVKTAGEAKALMLKLYVKAGGALPAEAPGPDASLLPAGSYDEALKAMKKYAK
jgi:hypothetical protein